MRFRFCWDCDCPDWLLAEMLTLSKINPTNLRTLSLDVAESICGKKLNYDHVVNTTSSELDATEIKASVAAIRWIMESAAGSNTDPQVLESELQQLGLPKDKSGIMKDIYLEEKENLRDALKDQSLKASGKVQWSYELKGINLGESQEPVVKLCIEGQDLEQNPFPHTSLEKKHKPESSEKDRMKSNDSKSKVEIHILPDQLNALLYELNKAYVEMKELDQS